MAKTNADISLAESVKGEGHPPTSGPKPPAGKSVVVIPCGMAAEGCARPANAAMAALKAIGWHGLLIDGQNDPTKQAAAVRQAIADKAQGIIVLSVDANQIAEPLREARKAGIKIVLFAGANEGNLYNFVVYPDASTTAGAYQVGEFAYKLSGGHLRMVMFDDNEFSTQVSRIRGTLQFLSACKAAGGDCKLVASQDFLVANLSTALPQQAADLVRRSPDANVIWSGYDAATTFIQQGLQQAGLLSKTAAVSFDCNSPNVAVIRQGGWEKGCSGVAAGWGGYATVDSLNRLFNGQQPLTDAQQGLGTKLIVQSNAPAGPYEGDVNYAAAYERLWKNGR